MVRVAVVHAIEGRVRLRLRDAIAPGLAARLGAQLDLRPEVRDWRIAPACSSVVLEYDSEATGAEALAEWVTHVCETAPAEVPSPVGAPSAGQSRVPPGPGWHEHRRHPEMQQPARLRVAGWSPLQGSSAGSWRPH